MYYLEKNGPRIWRITPQRTLMVAALDDIRRGDSAPWHDYVGKLPPVIGLDSERTAMAVSGLRFSA